MVRYLIDKSAYARIRLPAVDAVLTPMIADGDAGVCGAMALELLYSARNASDFQAIRRALFRSMVAVQTLEADFQRALDVMEALSRRGQHRSAGLSDLLIAAVAERNDLTVVHYDADYDLIAAVTEQPMEWVVPRGSI